MNGKVCARCQREFFPKKSGVIVIEHANSLPGPYKIFQGDLWGCAGCGAEIVMGISHKAIAEHWHPDFSAMVASARQSGNAVECFEIVEAPL